MGKGGATQRPSKTSKERKRWPLDAEEAREDALATALDTQSILRRAMEQLQRGKAMPVAIELFNATNANNRTIEHLRLAKQ